MSPKKAAEKKAAKAKAKSQAALPSIDADASASAGSAAGPDAPDSTVPHPSNVEYLDKLAQAWATVTSHPVFDNLVNQSPLEIEVRVVNNFNFIIASSVCGVYFSIAFFLNMFFFEEVPNFGSIFCHCSMQSFTHL